MLKKFKTTKIRWQLFSETIGKILFSTILCGNFCFSIVWCAPLDISTFSKNRDTVLEYKEAIKLPDLNRGKVKKLKIFFTDGEIDLSLFPNLTELYVSSCSDVKLLKNIPSTLEIFDIEDSSGIHLVPKDYKNLKLLAIRQCENASITGELPATLEELLIEVCDDFRFESDFSPLKKIRLLDTAFKNQLNLELEGCSRLQDFSLCGCSNVKLTGDFPASLRDLEILNNRMIPFPLNLASCVNLQKISISEEITSVDLGGSSNLKSIQARNNKNFSLLGKLPYTLEYLDFFHVSFAQKPNMNFQNYTNLKADIDESL
ncbi:MAG: hypothetical protein LBF54_00945 [Holosporaceae bacterium]|nr:hypothetical protein [Holosporaceae bacterium]